MEFYIYVEVHGDKDDYSIAVGRRSLISRARLEKVIVIVLRFETLLTSIPISWASDERAFIDNGKPPRTTANSH